MQWGGNEEASCLEAVLRIISSGAFPPTDRRADLTRGQRNQLRDAMIFCTHVRDGRELFVSDDRKAFIDGGRRELLQTRFATRIVTSDEFVAEFDCQAAG
jgi:hypothetical protein